ncbi:MAG: hypothetical protein WC528_02105 [Patescibacteria group bacterium]
MIKNRDNKIKVTQLSGLLIKWVFQYAFVSYLFFYLLETLSPGFITRSYNLNYHLGFVIIISLFHFIAIPVGGEAKTYEKPKIKDFIFSIIFSLIASVAINYRLNELGSVSYLISILSGLIILSLTLYILLEDRENI